MKLKLLAVVALLIVGGGAVVVALGGLPRSAAASSTYLTATAAIADVEDDVAATGAVASSASWTLAFGSSPTETTADDTSAASDTGTGQDGGTWVVKSVEVKVGDLVTKGQVLATATNPDLAASIVAAKNDWTAARLGAAGAQDAYDSATETSAIRQTRSQLLNATNQVASTLQAYRQLQATARLSRLTAPAAGVVTGLNVTAGADAPSGAAITLDSTAYQVTAEVVESDIASMRLQQPATVTIAAVGADLTGTVTAIAPTASTSSSGNVVSYAVTVALSDPPKTVRAGMTAEVTITTASASQSAGGACGRDPWPRRRVQRPGHDRGRRARGEERDRRVDDQLTGRGPVGTDRRRRRRHRDGQPATGDERNGWLGPGRVRRQRQRRWWLRRPRRPGQLTWSRRPTLSGPTHARS